MKHIRYKVTRDRDLIMRCLTSSWKSWSRMGGDGVDPELFFPLHKHITWLKCGKYGVFMGIDMGNGVWDCHAALLPCSTSQGNRIAIGAYAWAFRNLDCKECISTIPRHSLGVIKFAEKLGLKLIKEELHTVTYGITKEEFWEKHK